MKLKKIASLALAGVMAVSMLAGCASEPATTPNTDEPEVSTSVDVAAALNDVAAVKDVDVEFSNDAKITAALEQVLKVYGAKAMTSSGVDSNFAAAVARLAGLEQVPASSVVKNIAKKDSATGNGYTWYTSYFLSEEAKYAGTNVEKDGDLNGKNFTYYKLEAYKAGSTEAAIVNQFANGLVDLIGANSLPAVSYGATSAKYEGKYYDYDYTCPVGVASVKDTDGQTIYIFAYALTQTPVEKAVG